MLRRPPRHDSGAAFRELVRGEARVTLCSLKLLNRPLTVPLPLVSDVGTAVYTGSFSRAVPAAAADSFSCTTSGASVSTISQDRLRKVTVCIHES